MKNSEFPIKVSSIFFGAGVMLALYASSLYRYVLFHSLVEMFSILVAFVIFVLAWNTRRIQDNHYFLFIGIASLFSGALDLAHTFAYKGLGVFTGSSEDLATQLWIAFRYVFSLSFLIAPFFIERKLKPPRTFAAYFFITSLLFVTIFLRRFPACYAEGTGLTPFKIISEYIISFIFLASLGLLLRKRSAFDRDVLRLVVLSLLSSIASELSFTHYVSVYGFANMLGHYFELLSYYLIYRAIVVTGVVEPSNLLFRNLKLSEAALRESEAKYRFLFENMIDGFAYHKIIVDEKGLPIDYVFLEANIAFERLTGLKRKDIIGKPAREVLPGIENDPADWIGAYGRVALVGKEIRFEQYSEALKKWVSVSAYSPMKEYFVAVFEDITERKKAEEALRASEEQFRTLADSIPNLAWWANGDGYITWYNRRWYEYTGTTPEHMEGWGWQSVHDPKVLPIVLERWKASIATGEPFDMEFPLRGADGLFRSFLTRVLPLKDSVGRVLRWFGTNTDISAIKQAEEALRKSREGLEIRVRERTAELAQTVNTLQTEVDERLGAEEKNLRLNRLYSVLTKINEAIVRIHDPQKLYEQVCRIAVEDGLFKMAWIGLTDPDTLRIKPAARWGDSGGYLDGINIYAADVPEGKGPTGRAAFQGTYVIGSDIEHDPMMLPWRDKALQHGFRSSSAFPLRAGSTVIGALTIYSDKPRFFTDEEISLLSSLTDDISFAIDSMANEKKRMDAEEALRLASAYNRRLIEASLDPLVTIDANGKITDVNIGTEKATGHSREDLIGTDFSDYFTKPAKAKAGYQQVFSEGSVQNYPLEILHRDGYITPVLYNAAVYHDDAGNVIGVFAAARDITERTRAEEEVKKLNRELEQRVIERTAQLEAANKELDAFAYSVSHDLRAPLRIIDGFSRAIEDEYAGRLDETGRDYFQRVRAASLRMSQLIDALLNLSRLTRGEINRTAVDMSSLVRAAADDLQRTQPERRVEFVIAAGVTARGDPVMLRAVVDNLLGNAWKFTEKRELARIEFGVTRKDGKDVCFVWDNGAGFDMSYANKLFTPFQRLHSTSEFPGLGIGLATVQRIVTRHGNRIWAEGAVDKGATFYFTL